MKYILLMNANNAEAPQTQGVPQASRNSAIKLKVSQVYFGDYCEVHFEVPRFGSRIY